MAPPRIILKELKPKMEYICEMCKKTSRKNKFLWRSWFNDRKLIICRDCAYREQFGTKNMNKAKKDGILEKKEINQ